jgi:hypothetical protein
MGLFDPLRSRHTTPARSPFDWGTVWLLADRATGHTDRQTQALADRLDIRFVWLPTQAPELNAMDQLWRELRSTRAKLDRVFTARDG